MLERKVSDWAAIPVFSCRHNFRCGLADERLGFTASRAIMSQGEDGQPGGQFS